MTLRVFSLPLLLLLFSCSIHRKEVDTETQTPLSAYYLNMQYEDWKLLSEQTASELASIGNKDSINATYENDFNPDDYKDIEISSISKEQFNEIQKGSQKLFSANNTIKKVNGIITIGKKQFKDTINTPYQNTYTYLGEYKSPNAYILEYMCSECEEYSYEVIDKITGDIMQSTESFPFYSPDGKTILCLNQLFSDSPTAVSVYKTPKPERYVYKEFGSWIPVGDAFWGEDGSFYTEAIPYTAANLYYNNQEKHNRKKYNFRHLKITIKGPTPQPEE